MTNTLYSQRLLIVLVGAAATIGGLNWAAGDAHARPKDRCVLIEPADPSACQEP